MTNTNIIYHNLQKIYCHQIITKQDINDTTAMILSLYPKHLSKLNKLNVLELSGSLRQFVWSRQLYDNIQSDNCNQQMNSDIIIKNNTNIKQLIYRILET